MKRLRLISILLLLPILASAQLRKNEVAIEFKYSNGSYTALIQRGGEPSRKKVLLENGQAIDELSKKATLYDDQNSQQAYQLILAPLTQYLRQGDKIFFSPAGQLHFINLAALIDDHGHRCLERYTFYRLSDITKPVKDEPLTPRYMPVILYGGMNYMADPDLMVENCWFLHQDPFFLEENPVDRFPDRLGWGVADIDFGTAEDGTRAGYSTLTSSRGEIKFIYHLNRFQANVNTGPQALEERFKQDTRRDHAYVMHISTHSFQTSIPPRSKTIGMTEEEIIYKSCGLLFSGAGHTLQGEKMPYNMNDGLLYADEIAHLDMHNCELMVVGACNTALGRVSQNGVIGLQSAFKKAGAKTLLLTLWSVNDRATSFFMQQFYTYLGKGKSKYESFNRARQDMIKSQDFSDPVYWAPFILLD